MALQQEALGLVRSRDYISHHRWGSVIFSIPKDSVKLADPTVCLSIRVASLSGLSIRDGGWWGTLRGSCVPAAQPPWTWSEPPIFMYYYGRCNLHPLRHHYHCYFSRSSCRSSISLASLSDSRLKFQVGRTHSQAPRCMKAYIYFYAALPESRKRQKACRVCSVFAMKFVFSLHMCLQSWLLLLVIAKPPAKSSMLLRVLRLSYLTSHNAPWEQAPKPEKACNEMPNAKMLSVTCYKQRA